MGPGRRVKRMAMLGRTLRWLVSRIDQSRTYYLLGEVEIADGRGPALAGRLDSVDTDNPASYRGGILCLHYARAAELGPWLDLVAARGEMVVQFWLKPGEVAVMRISLMTATHFTGRWPVISAEDGTPVQGWEPAVGAQRRGSVSVTAPRWGWSRGLVVFAWTLR